ncbi:MAG: polysaccharide biosynthesis protein [Oscillospiraceae bacterium]|nr:polysaccharide biosynthesis protein [Oscillospiraceae bacterium]
MKLNVKSLAFGAAILTASQIFSQAVGFAFRVALSRMVGAEGMGLYQLIMPAYSVVMSVTAYGLTVAVSKLSASYSAVGGQATVRRLVRLALWVFFALLGAAAIIIAPLSDWISVTLLSDARTRLGLLLLLPCIFFTGIENICKNYFYGIREVRPPAITEVIEQLLRTACVLGLLSVLRPAHLEWAVGVIVIGMVLCEIVSASMLGFFYIRHMRKTPPGGSRLSDGPKPAKLLGEMAGVAIPVGASMLIANLLGSINTIIIPNRLMASGMGQTEALSAYGVAFGMTLPLTALPSVFVIPLSLTLMPRIAHYAALNDRAGLQTQVRRTLRLAAALVLPSCLLLMPLGPFMARSLFTDSQAGRYIEVLAVTQVFSCFQYLMNSLLNGMGKQRRGAVNLLLSDAVQLILTWYAVAVPELRLTGFVAAHLLTTAMCAILNLKAVTRTAGIYLSLDKWLIGPLLAAATATGGVYAVLFWMDGAGAAAVMPALFCGLGLYALLYRLTRR